MRSKPLKDLLAEADQILGTTKTASAASRSDEVSSLADTLTFASAIESQFSMGAMDKVASAEEEGALVALNKQAASIELEEMLKVEMFVEHATKKGFSQEQIDEALNKTAAERTKKHLTALVNLGNFAVPTKDKNSLEPKVHASAVGEEKRRVPATHNVGGE